MIGPLYTNFHRDFPGLPAAAIEFFHLTNISQTETSWKARTVLDFAHSIGNPTGTSGNYDIPKFHHLGALLDRMVDLNMLQVVNRSKHPLLGDGSYMCTLNEPIRTNIKSTIDFIIYGFPVIYEEFRKSVIPIVHEAPDGRQQIGSAFLTRDNTLLTAAHCISNAKRISILGIDSSEFGTAEVAISTNSALDLAAMNFKAPILNGQRPIELGVGGILQDVLTMGYPNVPTFATTLAAEKATISARLTAVKGAIASKPKEIFAKTDLFLVTARVRGGFSGGPVINGAGVAVGIISRTPASEEIEDGIYAQYDNLGYGVAIPAEDVVNFLRGCASRDDEKATFVRGRDRPEYVGFSQI